MEEYWNHLQSCVTSSAEESVGRVHSYPGWFKENINVLKLLIEEKNQARLRYLQVGTRSCKQTYRRLQHKVQKAITDVKSKWILKVAKKERKL